MSVSREPWRTGAGAMAGALGLLMLVVGAACSSSNPSCSQEERCSGPADCPSGQYCASGCCLLGCDEDSDCVSDHCQNGFCCESGD